ncbi:MAG: hypothetical protein QOG63_262 [Thermoleophilaceae bacterium]|nr:hypothetical protein [Thermoleophilaceae bacterium]
MAARVDIQRRPGGWVDRARAYKILIDGSEVGRIKAGEAHAFELAPGAHELHLAIDWTRSPSVEMQLAEGERAQLFCRPNANPLTVLWFITFGRGRYIRLERTG